MSKEKQFKKGQVVKSGNNMVLVTGKGQTIKQAGYKCFAGVVVFGKKRDGENWTWAVGTYSETWAMNSFKLTRIPLNTVMGNVDKLLKH